jgi:ribosomal protein S18 acetylase RimI-like enzyme
MKTNLEIRLLQKNDIQPIAAAFARLGWNKPASQYQRYLKEQQAGERLVLVASDGGIFAGYLTILWESPYPFFWQAGIPEIVDFNVLPKFRRQGIGSRLMDEAEALIAERSPVAGIGVGMTADYGAAQILYVKRGYIPDGRGLSQDSRLLTYGDHLILDDSLAIYFTKSLRNE